MGGPSRAALKKSSRSAKPGSTDGRRAKRHLAAGTTGALPQTQEFDQRLITLVAGDNVRFRCFPFSDAETRVSGVTLTAFKLPDG